VGLWAGLSLGLTLVAIVLVWVWRRHVDTLIESLAAPAGLPRSIETGR
jgi:Na+-driven multidrug efflux pump